MHATPPRLTATQARILGVLIEKEKTTPDAYPLTLNSLTLGCNQKTSRDPVMNLSEREVQAALDELRDLELISDSYGASGRVMRYAHHFRKVYGVPGASVALLATLMLRGPQTVSELRSNADRLNHFVDASTVEGFLDELANWSSGALVVKLPKQPGSSAHRWAHLLCGEVTAEAFATQSNVPAGKLEALEERVTQLENELAELREALARLSA